MHLTITSRCTPESHSLWETSWLEYARNWDSTSPNDECAFLFKTDEGLFVPCGNTAVTGAHVSARQRFYILPACSWCNGHQGMSAYVRASDLKALLPQDCIHTFGNGYKNPEDAKLYGPKVKVYVCMGGTWWSQTTKYVWVYSRPYGPPPPPIPPPPLPSLSIFHCRQPACKAERTAVGQPQKQPAPSNFKAEGCKGGGLPEKKKH
jgi:hypothetical protein